MPLSNIPIIWSAQTLVVLRAATVFGAPSVTNRDFQGEIQGPGDRVRVTGVADPTIFDVPRNADMPAPETLTDDELEMVIDQSKGFNFQVDDLDRLQVLGGGTMILRSAANAGRKLALTADQSIAAKMLAEADPANALGTDAAPINIDAPQPGLAPQAGAIDVYRLLVRLGTKLDKANVPEQGRWVVLPPFMMGALELDQRFTNPVAASGEDTLRNGFQGRAAGFDVYTTTAVPKVGANYKVIAGSVMATSYAEQLVQVRFYEPERRFAQAAKGQHVYGHKTFYPEALAVATVDDVSGLDA
jgi:hypothetical protein